MLLGDVIYLSLLAVNFNLSGVTGGITNILFLARVNEMHPVTPERLKFTANRDREITSPKNKITAFSS